ncbi:MAG: FAD-binding domain-containing protein [Paracoccaceae bacterium]
MLDPCHSVPHLEPIYETPSLDLPKPADLGLAPDGGDDLQDGGSTAARALLHSFLIKRGAPYRSAMSSPLVGADACSRLSPHLTFGTISLREVAQAATHRAGTLPKGPSHKEWRGSVRAFQSRLYWHCHFMQKLEDEPRIEWENMHPAYDGLRDDPQGHPWFEAWKAGQTGLPFLDACMRSLRHRGWLNFRMRAMVMAVASYHMWFHWRETGLHLARMFTDYEPGIHWSQVQMQSGTTGINTIRVYNPIKQGLDQDPSGVFIRRWVPELAQLSGDALHRPWLHPDAHGILGRTYPNPIFDPAARAKWAKDQIWAKRRAPDHEAGAVAVLTRHGSRKSPRKTKRAAKHTGAQLSLFD